MNINEILDINYWNLMTVDEALEFFKEYKKESSPLKIYHWENIENALSPLNTYKLLKAKFGDPNGYIMFLKNDNADNLIHWHYTFKVHDCVFNIFGKTSHIEISLHFPKKHKFFKKYWELIINNINQSFKKNGKEMKAVLSKMEHWKLFINPFQRIHQSLQYLIDQFENLNLKEGDLYRSTFTKKENNDYYDALNKWADNIVIGATLGTSIITLCPILAESFINLIILVLRKDEFKSDLRMYEGLLRSQIDIKVKSLHLNCIGFEKQIDTDSDHFKNFLRLMNRRNDVLHGNIDPDILFIDDVWFDNKYIPLFKHDEGMIKRSLKKYSVKVDRESAIGDYKIVLEFMSLVLTSLSQNHFMTFMHILDDRTPGINVANGRLGNLFPKVSSEAHIQLKK